MDGRREHLWQVLGKGSQPGTEFERAGMDRHMGSSSLLLRWECRVYNSWPGDIYLVGKFERNKVDI